MQQTYFTFNWYNSTGEKLEKEGKYIFQNRPNDHITINIYNTLPHLIFKYITNGNLDELELFFKFAGFSSFTKEELPKEIVQPEAINLKNKPAIIKESPYIDDDEIEKIIEFALEEGIIQTFTDFKKKENKIIRRWTHSWKTDRTSYKRNWKRKTKDKTISKGTRDTNTISLKFILLI